MHGRAPLSVHVCAFVSTLRFHQEEKIQYVFSFTQRYCQPMGGGGGCQRVVVDVLEERVKYSKKNPLQMFIMFKSSCRRIVKLNRIHISGGETAGENMFGGGQMSLYTPEGLNPRSITNRR